MKTNKDKLVAMSAQGKITHPYASPGFPYRMESNGKLVVVPTIGGITYNVRIGDSAYDLVGDHVEPGVSIRNSDEKTSNAALCLMSCIGNTARVVSGDAKGELGTVTGIHGGCDHVIIDFPPEVLEKMAIGDEILVRTLGQGLAMTEHPDVKVMSIDPELFEKLGLLVQGDAMVVPVAAIVPSHLMGSGIGSNCAYTGDYDLMTADRKEIAKLKLDALRFGDIVFLQDCDNSYGRCFRKGAASVGIVVHSDCAPAGHGPGITTILTCALPGKLEPKITAKANIADYLGLGRR